MEKNSFMWAHAGTQHLVGGKMRCLHIKDSAFMYLPGSWGAMIRSLELPEEIYMFPKPLLTTTVHEKPQGWAGELAQQVRAPTAVLKVLSSNPSIHMVVHNHL